MGSKVMPGLWQTARGAWSVGPVAAAATSANASCLWVGVGILLGSSNALWLEESQSHMRSVSSVPGALLLDMGSMPALPALLRVGCLPARCQGK